MTVVFPAALGAIGTSRLHVLQSLVLPASAGPAVALHVRWAHPGRATLGPGGLTLPPGSSADLSTFYNGFGAARWRRLAGVGVTALRLQGSGHPEVVLDGWTAAGVRVELQRARIDLGPNTMVAVGHIPEGIEMLGLRLVAPDDADAQEVRLSGGEWLTDRPPLREVRLAAVMTTFRRESAARAGIRTFESRVMTPDHPEVAHLFVIDNGNTLPERADARVTVEHSPNLGGAGGFTRGLLHARDAGSFTHALFMDDDAACVPESVWRACRLLAHATDPRLSVAGAMLLADRPTVQYERSGRFRVQSRSSRLWHSVGGRVDLADPGNVASNEALPDGNYGGWWFFAFPLAAVTALPFPWFVRGDDTDFALANRLPVAGLNGIAAFCADLALKRTPSVAYLASRSWAGLALTYCNRWTAGRTLRRVLRDARRTAGNHDYARAEAMLMAVEDVLAGPEAVADTLPFARFKALATADRGRPMAASDLSRIDPPTRRRRLARLAHAALGQGHLAITRRGPNRVMVCPDDARLRRVSDRDHATKGYPVDDQIRLFDRDDAAYRRIIARSWRLFWRTLGESGRAADHWRRATPALRSEAAWRARLGLPPKP